MSSAAQSNLNTIRSLQSDGKRKRGHPSKTWEEPVEGDLIDWWLSAEDALDRVHWKSVLRADHAPSDTLQVVP